MEEVVHVRRRKKLLILGIIVGIVVLGFVALIEICVRPVIADIAEAQIRTIVSVALNEAATENSENIDYDQLVKIERDNEGTITMVQLQTAVMNDYASRIAQDAQQKLSELGEVGLDVPLGAVLGGQIFANSGPLIHVTYTPVSSVTTNFGSVFEEAGINQTHHKIYANMNAWVRVVLPRGGKVFELDVQVPVYEAIIVGKVPETTLSGLEGGDLLNLLP